MTVPLFAQVIANCPERDGEYQVLLALAARADHKTGRIWFCYDSLALDARVSDKTLTNALKSLVASGRLTVYPQAAPHGYDMYTINVPGTRVTWADVTATRAARKAAPKVQSQTYSKRRAGPVRRTFRSLPALALMPDLTSMAGFSISAPVRHVWTDFFSSHSPIFSIEIENISIETENISIENPLPAAPSAEIQPPNPLLNPLLNIKEVAIDFTGNAGATPALSDDAFQAEGQTQNQTQEPEPEWTDEDDLLLGLTPDGVVPDGTPTDSLTLGNDADSVPEGEKDDEELEQVPPAAPRRELPAWLAIPDLLPELPVPELPRPAAALLDDVYPVSQDNVLPARRTHRSQPGDAVHRELEAMAGGPIKARNLPGLLKELGHNGVKRELWLALELPEVYEARADASKCHLEGEGAFRTLLFERLDNLALTGRLGGVPVKPKAAIGAYGASTATFPGQGLGTVAPDLFPPGSRVLLDNRWPGVVREIGGDVVSRFVTLELDDHRDVVMPCKEVQRRLKAYEAPLPEAVSTFSKGQMWVHKKTGERVTVCAKDGMQMTLQGGRDVTTVTIVVLTRDFVHVQA